MGNNIDYSYLNKPIEAAVERKLAEKGGGGYNGGMDAWQNSVETRLSSLDDKMGRISDSVARIEIKLASLPDKWFIIGTIIALLVLIIAAVALGADLKPHK